MVETVAPSPMCWVEVDERRQHRQRLQPQRVGGMRLRVGIEIVAHEDQVELAALGGLPDPLDRRKILKAVDCARIAPARDMAAGAQDEQAEMHLSFHGGHVQNRILRSRKLIRPKNVRLIAEATKIADQTCTKSICSTAW